MTFKASDLKHLSGPVATLLTSHITGTASADELCRGGIAYPIAIELRRQMTVGVGDIGALHRAGFSADDAKTIAAAITTRGAH